MARVFPTRQRSILPREDMVDLRLKKFLEDDEKDKSFQYQGEMREGMFDWHLERFLEDDKKRKSSMFIFGRHKAYLSLSEKSSKPVSTDLEGSKSTKMYSPFHIYLHITKLLGRDVFSHCTFYKASFVARDGAEYIVNNGCIFKEKSIYELVVSDAGWIDEKSAELLPDGNLTFRLAWNHKQKRSDPIREQQTALLETLSYDFSRFESKTDTDCTLRVGEVQIPVHRSVLTARSSVFAEMFRRDTSENRNGIVDVLDVDAAVLSAVIHYIYSGEIRGLSTDTVGPMYAIADRYDLIELRGFCLDISTRNLKIENFCDAAVLSDKHGVSKVEERVLSFMGDRLEEVLDSNQWKELSDSKPSLAIKLLQSALRASKKKVKIMSDG